MPISVATTRQQTAPRNCWAPQRSSGSECFITESFIWDLHFTGWERKCCVPSSHTIRVHQCHFENDVINYSFAKYLTWKRTSYRCHTMLIWNPDLLCCDLLLDTAQPYTVTGSVSSVLSSLNRLCMRLCYVGCEDRVQHLGRLTDVDTLPCHIKGGVWYWEAISLWNYTLTPAYLLEPSTSHCSSDRLNGYSNALHFMNCCLMPVHVVLAGVLNKLLPW